MSFATGRAVVWLLLLTSDNTHLPVVNSYHEPVALLSTFPPRF
jgi:hypothetical protein